MTYDDWKTATPPEYEQDARDEDHEHDVADAEAERVALLADDDFDPTICCGVTMTFDPEQRGQTCGGHALKGWNMCLACGAGRIAKGLSVEDKGETNQWSLAKGGRSLSAGAIKIRAEKGDSAAIEAVMARIARLPALEAELLELRAQLANPCVHRKP